MPNHLPSHRTPRAVLATIGSIGVAGLSVGIAFDVRGLTWAPTIAALATTGVMSAVALDQRRKRYAPAPTAEQRWASLGGIASDENGADIGMAVVVASQIVDANTAFGVMTGYTAGAALGSLDLSSSLLAELASNVADGGSGTIVTRLRTGSGGEILTTLSARMLDEDGSDGIVIVLRDTKMSPRTRSGDKRDGLTGLPGRASMDRHLLGRVGPGGERSIILSVDLCRFHAINDIHGYTMGDEVLCRVGARLQAALPNDAVIGRMAGDKFLVVAAMASEEDGPAIAKRLHASLAPPLAVGDTSFFITASIGFCITPDDADNADLALRRADLALRRAKNTTTDASCRFEPFMAAAANMRASIETDLHDAMNRNELFLEYQPQFNATTKTLLGFEALLRWRHPTRGIVPPLQFVSVAEQSGLIHGIGKWVLREACREAARWPSHLRVAVNVSASQFVTNDLVETVASTLRETGLLPHRLDLELTESVLLDNHARNIDMLRRLRAHGTPISMDDFGTGYSSLSYLRQFPFSRIKIDRSFVRDMVQDSATRSIVQIIVKMSETLGMSVIAEGVETTAQLDILRDLNCDQVQGYLFGRPAPIAHYADLIEQSVPSAPAAASLLKVAS